MPRYHLACHPPGLDTLDRRRATARSWAMTGPPVRFYWVPPRSRRARPTGRPFFRRLAA